MNTLTNIPTKILQLITADQAWHYAVIPKGKENKTLTLFIADSANAENAKNELEMIYGTTIKLIPHDASEVHKALGKYYRKSQIQQNKTLDYSTIQSDDILMNLISEANSIGSSDIHLETFENICRVRMRLDGKLVERYILEKEDYPAIINKVKIKANLDIAEKRLPQDGRIFYHQGTDKFDIRVSVLPTLHGEKVVMRLLSKDATHIELESLGFTKEQLEKYTTAIKKPHGIILISGPTGSGKTTTLYATLKILNQDTHNILTIEDPIEYTLDGINQVQLKESIGLSFASALRTFLRQDPDIIMLGEIRDGETAQMATRAALTGHLVLSTIHTNSAWGTISRLIDMGVPPFLVANTLNLSVAQRLLRLLCPDCKQEAQIESDPTLEHLDKLKGIAKHFVPTGCESCFYTGYKGRKAIYEIISIDRDWSQAIKEGTSNVQTLLKEKNVKSLADSAVELYKQGKTSLEEIYAILLADAES